MRAGTLKTRAVFERRSVGASDGRGNTADVWNTICSRSVSLDEMSGAERQEGGALAPVVGATMHLRRDDLTAGLTTGDRVLARGVRWNIRAVRWAGARGAGLVLDLQRGVAV